MYLLSRSNQISICSQLAISVPKASVRGVCAGLLLSCIANPLQVDEARKVLLDALEDAWPSDDFIEIFAKTAARICIQQAFVLGRSTPYVQQVVHAPNMGTHLHKCGVGMVRGTLQSMLASPQVKPYFSIIQFAKNQPPAILCLLANCFCGHPSDTVKDIVEQTYADEPTTPAPYPVPATIGPRSSLTACVLADKHTDSDSVSEASTSSRAADIAASPPRLAPTPALRRPEEHTEPMPSVCLYHAECVEACSARSLAYHIAHTESLHLCCHAIFGCLLQSSTVACVAQTHCCMLQSVCLQYRSRLVAPAMQASACSSIEVTAGVRVTDGAGE